MHFYSISMVVNNTNKIQKLLAAESIYPNKWVK